LAVQKEKQNYSYTDSANSAFYRLEMVDLDGKTDFSKIIFVKNEADKQASIGNFFENPSKEDPKIVIRGSKNSEWNIKQFNYLGKLISTEKRQLVEGLNELTLSTNNQKGIQIFVFVGEGKSISRKLMVQ
jgi:hypothetical protein